MLASFFGLEPRGPPSMVNGGGGDQSAAAAAAVKTEAAATTGPTPAHTPGASIWGAGGGSSWRSGAPVAALDDGWRGGGTISIAPYKKCITVSGTCTAPIKETLKELGGRWNPSLVSWIFPGSQKNEVLHALAARHGGTPILEQSAAAFLHHQQQQH
jgi:hypothetical protein